MIVVITSVRPGFEIRRNPGIAPHNAPPSNPASNASGGRWMIAGRPVIAYPATAPGEDRAHAKPVRWTLR